MLADDISHDDRQSSSSSSLKMNKSKKSYDSLQSLSKQTAAPRNKYLNNLNINSNSDTMKLKISGDSNDYPTSSLQSPLPNKIKNGDDIPSIPLPMQNIIFQPSCCWIERKLKNKNNNNSADNQTPSSSSSLYYNNNTYHILTSFIPSGISILCHSTIKSIDIHFIGASLLKVTYYKDSTAINNNDPNNSPANNNIVKNKNVVTVTEISLPSLDIGDDGDCYLPQRVSLPLPYPCVTVDISLLKRKLDFVCIMGIAAYANTIRSSSLSTPHK